MLIITAGFSGEMSANAPSRIRILLISMSETGLHVICNLGGQAPFRRSFLIRTVACGISQVIREQSLTMTGVWNTTMERDGLEQASVANKHAMQLQ